jgi:integrase
MSEFTVTTVDRWLQWILTQPTAESNRRLSFTTELKVLHRLLNWYRNYIEVGFTIPIVERHREDAKFKRTKKRRRDFFIREQDIRPWIDWLSQNYEDPFFFQIAQFMVLTGARLGEVCGLKWESVNLDRGDAHITSVMCWDQKTRLPYPDDDVKTSESDRIIQLPTAVVTMLQELQQRSGRTNGLVFVDLSGSTPTDNAIRNRFDRGFRELGLPWSSTRILRHTWGTLARVATSDLNKVQAVMGHTDIKMTQRYAKVAAMLDKSTVEDTAALMGF